MKKAITEKKSIKTELFKKYDTTQLKKHSYLFQPQIFLMRCINKEPYKEYDRLPGFPYGWTSAYRAND